MKKFLIIPILTVLLLGVGGFYQVPVDSQAVVFSFGKVSGTEGPGLHWRMPLVTDHVTLPTKRELRMEFGTVDTQEGGRSPRSLEASLISNMVTADRNSLNVNWRIQYLIDDPQAFILNNTNPRETLSDLSEAVMRQIVGDRGVDEVLTNREDVRVSAKNLLQEEVNKLKLGISINQLQVGGVDPPSRVKVAFNEVSTAKQQKEQTINRAQSLYNQEVPKAKGLADRRVSVAEGFRDETINRAKGEVARFLSVFEEYRKSPEVTSERLYLETMGRILKSTESYIVEGGDSTSPLPLLYMQGQTNARKPVPPTNPNAQEFDAPSRILRAPSSAQ